VTSAARAPGPIAALRRLWRSVAFRLAFNYGLMTLFFMLLLLAIVYFQTVVGQRHQGDRQIAVSMQRLAAQYAQEGPAELAAQIAFNLADGIDTDSEVLLLVDAAGAKAAGNLAPSPHLRWEGDGIVERTALRGGRPARVRLLVRRLDDGSTLIVGRDLRDQQRTEAVVGRATLAAALAALLLVAVGAYVFRRDIEARVADIRRTAARVGDGEIGERLPVGPPEDEFARLGLDLNRMLDRMQDLMEGVRRVSDTIAHNLRTPLSRVLLRLRAAERGDDPAALREAVRAAGVEIEELAVVFEKLLQIAEAEAGARRQRFGPVDLGAVAADLAELYDAVAEAQGARVEHADDGRATVRGDRDLLGSAVANLLDNALKYGGAGARVRLRTERAGDRVRLVVEDDGPGVPAEERPRILGRFHRLRPELPGTGLGLASVSAIVGLHGGTLAMDDARPGLRVTVDLPAHAAAPA
jgi:signal transduction histidine kinase